jgi:methyl-accepting chemotaxis protein
MKRVFLAGLILGVSVLLASCEGEKMVWEPAVEQATFTEIDQSLPAVREAMMDLNETINKRITSRRYKEEALEQFKGITDFVDVVQFYYLPILNARAHIARAYREINHGMYAEASDDIKKAVDNINKASLKSTDNTKAGFDEVKRGLMEVTQVSDQSKDASLISLSNAAKKLNLLIEKIKPTVQVTEEGESLIDGQF